MYVKQDESRLHCRVCVYGRCSFIFHPHVPSCLTIAKAPSSGGARAGAVKFAGSSDLHFPRGDDAMVSVVVSIDITLGANCGGYNGGGC